MRGCIEAAPAPKYSVLSIRTNLILSLSKDVFENSRHRRKSKEYNTFDACILSLRRILRQAQDEERVEGTEKKTG